MQRLAMVVGLASVLALPSSAAAQTPEPIEFVSTTTVTVKPDRVADFEQYARQVLDAAAKTGMDNRWDGYQMLHGGSPFVYTFVTGHASLADLDNAPRVPDLLAKAYGKQEGMRILNQGRDTIETVETQVLRHHGDLSANAKPPADARYIYGIEMTVRPEMTDRFLETVRQSKAPTEQTPDAPTVLYHSVMLGQSGQFMAVLPFDSWAERAKWPAYDQAMIKALGEEAWKKMDEVFDQAVVERHTWVVMHRPDLSHIPKPSTN